MINFESANTLNIPLARKVLEHCIAHPEEHDQKHFSRQTVCGTTACIAGTAIMMDAESSYTSVTGEGGAIFMGLVNTPEEHEIHPETRGRELLGLTAFDAESVFYTFDNSEALNRLAAYISAAEVAQY